MDGCIPKHKYIFAPLRTLECPSKDSPCDCEPNNPGFLDARLFPFVVFAVAPVATMDEASSLSPSNIFRSSPQLCWRERASVIIFINPDVPAPFDFQLFVHICRFVRQPRANGLTRGLRLTPNPNGFIVLTLTG